MKPFMLILAAIVAAHAAVAQAQTYQSGMTMLEITNIENGRDLEGFVWYPTEATGPVTLDFKSEVWAGSAVVRDAMPAMGKFPLVVLSHGKFGELYSPCFYEAFSDLTRS